MTRTIPIILALMLTGCGFTPQGNVLRGAVFSGVQKAGEAGLENAEKFMCELAPVGAVKRRYGTPEAAAAYKKLCERGGAENIIAPKMIAPAN